MKYFIAHRGKYNQKINENTIPAFLGAINDDKFKGFELDIHTTKDNIFVVNHSFLYQGKIINKTNYQELKLPKLEDILKLKTNKIIMIEIKEYDIDIKRLEKILAKYSNKNIYVISFINNVIAKLNNKYCKKGLLDYGLNNIQKYSYDFICLLKPIINLNTINYYQNLNILVFIYGINSSKDLIYSNVYYIIDAFLIDNIKE